MTSLSQKLLVLVSASILVPVVIAATTLGGSDQNAVLLEDMQGYSAEDQEMLTRLKDFTATVESRPKTITTQPRELLPDVDQMIDRLAARLAASPQDIGGWQMLGWSYLNTGRYPQAADAFRKALALDPNSQELMMSYQAAMTKVNGANATAGERGPNNE